MEILYEDNHLIAVNKAHGILTQGDESGEPSLMDKVKEFIKFRDKKPGNVFLGLLHRLDRPVGGVLLFAKTSKGASRLSEQFRTHTIQKVYWAVLEGVPKPSQGEVIQWLRKDEAKNFVTSYDHEVPGTLKAELTYTVLKTKDGKALVEVRPKTGRPHQIRVGMSSLGTPILGDKKYGAEESLPDGNIALFAKELSFDQPVTKERVTVMGTPILPVFSSFE